MYRVMFGLAVATVVAGSAYGTPYWYTYEGNVLPEEDGWTRHSFGPPEALRDVSNGEFVIDSRASIHTAEFYDQQFEGGLNPGPQEEFVASWRLLVGATTGNYDVSVGFYSDDSWGAAFNVGLHSIRSLFEDGQPTANFDPLVYHAFEFRSADMRHYTLAVDGHVSLTGDLQDWVVDSSRVGWGDGVQGASSLSTWDYFRFGCVSTQPTKRGLMLSPNWSPDQFTVSPEPHLFLSCGVLCVFAFRRGR